MPLDKKLRSSPNVGPLDIGPSYLDSVFNAGTTHIDNLVSDASLTGSPTSLLDTPIFHPGTTGVRTTPNEGGFAYSDTPECTVFIQKREWVEDDWTYVTNATQRPGKVQELQTRIRIGNLITRKLDWLNDHELFTKFSDLTASLTKEYTSQVGSVNPLNTTLSGAQVTRYYTENLSLEENKVVNKKSQVAIPVANSVEVQTQDSGTAGRLLIHTEPSYSSNVITALHGPNTGGPSKVTVKTIGAEDFNKPSNIIPGENDVDPTGGVFSQLPEELPEEAEDRFESAQFWKIDLTSISPEYFFPEPSRDLALKGFGGGDRKAQQDFIRNKLKDGGLNEGVGYIARVPSGRTPRIQLAKATGNVTEVPVDITTEEIEKSSKQFENVFNGVIELTNVQSINTTVNNDGTVGQASLTLQNPNNILVISDEDIEIALGEDPFLSGAVEDETGRLRQDITRVDPTTGQEMVYRYYRGRYYTDRAYDLVTKQDTSALSTTTADAELRAAEQELQDALQAISEFLGGNITPQVVASLQKPLNFPISTSGLSEPEPFKVEQTVLVLGPQDTPTAEQRAHAQRRRQQIRNAIANIRTKLDSQSTRGRVAEAETSKEERNKRLQIKKYFQNRTIFQVYDRIFIWMSSPSRTVRTLEDGTPVSEDFTQGEVIAKRVQDTISLIRQLENLIQTVAAQTDQQIPPVFTASSLAVINSELFAEGKSKRWRELRDKVKETFQEDPTAAESIIQSATDIVSSTTDFLNFFNTSVEAPPQASAPDLVTTLIETVDEKIKQIRELKSSLKDDPSNDTLPGADTDTRVRGIDPTRLFSEDSLKFAGTVDQQFQVFQGVITGISRSYSDGVYEIQINCQDNLNFLSRSRFIDTPGLNQYVNRARPVLDDPIWRQKDAFVTSSIPDEIKPDDIFGRWKTGILTLTAAIQPDKDEKNTSQESSTGEASSADTTNTYTEEALHRAFGRSPQAENQAFEGADPAKIISVLTTGIPFDVPTYLNNTKFKGTVDVTPTLDSTPEVSHDGERLRVGPFEGVRRQIAGQVKKYGDFEPFFQASGPEPTPEEIADANARTQVNIATAIIVFFKTYIAARQDLTKDFAEAITEDKKESEKPSSAFKQITTDNIGEVIQPSETFPDEREQVQLASKFKEIAPTVLEFIIIAAIRGEEGSKINTMMTDAFDRDKFDIIESGFASDFENFEEREKLAMSSIEQANYRAISEAVQARINRGAIFDALSNAGSAITAEDVDLPVQTSKEDVFNFFKPQRDALLHPSVLQATRASIILKQKPNFLVISDQYLLSPDLVDYVRQIGNPGGSMQEHEYADVLNRCLKAAHTIDWEFYADSQGHLRFKPPTYNRVFNKHLLDIHNVEPTYRNQLLTILRDFNADGAIKAFFYTEYQSLFARLKQQALEILKQTMALAASTPIFIPQETGLSFQSLVGGLGTPQSNSLLAFMQQEQILPASDITKIRTLLLAPQDSTIPDTIEDAAKKNPEHSNVLDQLETDVLAGLIPEIKGIFDGLTDPNNLATGEPGEPIERPIFEKANGLIEAVTAQNSQEALTKRIERYQENYGPTGAVSPNIDTSLEEANSEIAEAAVVQIHAALRAIIICQDALDNIGGVLAGLTTELDRTLKAFTDEQFIHNIPSSIIISESWEENPPDFTRLDVQSAFAFAGENQNDLQNQFIHWAGSVDYDLWRMYGYIQDERQLPFLQSAQQAAVYGDMLMARQYSTILSGSLTVRGDSKYQPGDCVFVEDENLYYYIASVQHQFTYGSGYQTVLKLKYGRRPGYYIPYPFDVLGKNFTRGANILYSKSAQDLSEIFEAFQEADQQLQEDPNSINN